MKVAYSNIDAGRVLIGTLHYFPTNRAVKKKWSPGHEYCILCKSLFHLRRKILLRFSFVSEVFKVSVSLSSLVELQMQFLSEIFTL